MEVVDGIRAEMEVLEDLDVLASNLDGEDGHGELQLTRKEKWELREKGDGRCRTDVSRQIVWCEEGSTLRIWDEGRVLREVLESAFVDALEARSACMTS